MYMYEMVSWRQRLNQETFATETFSQLLGYYIQILAFCSHTLGIISELEIESINRMIQLELSKEFESPLQMQNWLYCINSYLVSLPNDEAFEKLKIITNKSGFKQLIDDTTKWITNQKMAMKTTLKNSQKAFKGKSLIEVEKHLSFKVVELGNWTLSGKMLSFASLHNQVISTGSVILSDNKDHFRNYFERLHHTIKVFCIEAGIITRLKGDLVNQANSLAEKAEEDLESQKLLEAESEYESNLKKLKKTYEDLIAEQESLQSIIDQKTENMTEEEFDEFYNSDDPVVQKVLSFDEVEEKLKYEKKQNDLYADYEAKRAKIHKVYHKSSIRININTDIISLTSLIKEFALFALVKQEGISYPETLDEKERMLQQLNIKKAVFSFY